MDARLKPPLNDPIVAYLDRKYLDSEAGRPVRILAEYLQPKQAFQDQGVQDTVVFFGSARLSSDGPLGKYYEDARKLAELVTKWSMGLPCDAGRFVVCTGGGGGIMEAANRGAQEAGGRTIGLNIGLPHEQRPNPYITPGLGFEFHYFFTRKLWFAHLARAMVAFPGGFGTLDELCEILTLSQTKKLARRIPVLLYGRSYWEEVINFEALARHGMISRADLDLFRFVDSPEEAFVELRDGLIPSLTDTEPSFTPSIHPGCPSDRLSQLDVSARSLDFPE
jgi:uncharacterized protein (TIGR00730 family)